MSTVITIPDDDAPLLSLLSTRDWYQQALIRPRQRHQRGLLQAFIQFVDHSSFENNYDQADAVSIHPGVPDAVGKFAINTTITAA